MDRFVRPVAVALPLSFGIAAFVACVLVMACGRDAAPSSSTDAGADALSQSPSGPLCEGCDPDPSAGCPCPGLGAACEFNACERGLICSPQNLCEPKGAGSACSVDGTVDDCVLPTRCQCADGGSVCTCQ